MNSTSEPDVETIVAGSSVPVSAATAGASASAPSWTRTKSASCSTSKREKKRRTSEFAFDGWSSHEHTALSGYVPAPVEKVPRALVRVTTPPAALHDGAITHMSPRAAWEAPMPPKT